MITNEKSYVLADEGIDEIDSDPFREIFKYDSHLLHNIYTTVRALVCIEQALL